MRLREEVKGQPERVLPYSNNQHAPVGASLLDVSPWPVQRSSFEGFSLDSEGTDSGQEWGGGNPFMFFPLTYSGDSHGSKAPNGHNQLLFPFAYQ